MAKLLSTDGQLLNCKRVQRLMRTIGIAALGPNRLAIERPNEA